MDEINEQVQKIGEFCDSLAKFLAEKNKRYGNSALEPLKIFSQADNISGILVRLDDKLSRIKNSPELRRNDVIDLAGYLVLLCIARGWTDFGDMID